jgi:metal-responsive CopG/Arc/MetJ family transcriptional regulator
MEISVTIDEDLLAAVDRAARFQNITRDEAFRGALTAWVAQARRDAVIHELFKMEFDSDITSSRATASEIRSASPAVEVE